MKTRTLLALCSLFAPVAVSVGEPLQLDKDFSFHLDQPTPETLPSAPFPSKSPRLEPDATAPAKTPAGRPLPPGTRSFEFNGQTYYRIPLAN